MYCIMIQILLSMFHPRENMTPPTGSFLGDMTDELESEYGRGSYITQFISGAPKTMDFMFFLH